MRITLPLILFVLLSCTQSNSKRDETKSRLNEEIVLINVGNADREQIGKALSAISRCAPKVIAINLLFRANKFQKADTVLSEAIRLADNVILPLNLEDGEIIGAAKIFAEACKAQGLVHYGFEDEKVIKQKLYYSHSSELIWSLPVTIASYYDIENSDKIMQAVLANQNYRIVYRFKDDEFKVLDIVSLEPNCSELSGKIVLMGYLGPGAEDTYDTPDGRRYGTYIIANSIDNILSRQFEKVE